MRTCAYCPMNDGTAYTSLPPMYKCSYTNDFHLGNHQCELELMPVVRCENCVNYDSYGEKCEGRGWCSAVETEPSDDFYCAYGVRKGEE